MNQRDIIVVGASAGGVKALTELCKLLPADLPASVLIVMHIPPWQKSHLPNILRTNGSLPIADPAMDGKIRPGRIYVAPPDHHLLVDDGHVQLWRGPKENRHRPAVNVLFRSAAVTYGPRVAGAILSGCLDDGSTGLWWVKQHGGVAIVQDPEEAEYPDMPLSALEYVNVDYTMGVAEIASVLTRMAKGEAGRSSDRLAVERK